jgi:hypothetical protein
MNAALAVMQSTIRAVGWCLWVVFVGFAGLTVLLALGKFVAWAWS